MTTEAKELEAGPELDALVATRVMGLPPQRTLHDPCPVCGGEMRFCGQRARCFDCNEWIYQPYKEYSSDILFAWEVVEKINLLKHRTLEYIPGEGGWWIDDNHNHAVQVCAPTVEVAICRAALAAMADRS